MLVSLRLYLTYVYAPGAGVKCSKIPPRNSWGALPKLRWRLRIPISYNQRQQSALLRDCLLFQRYSVQLLRWDSIFMRSSFFSDRCRETVTVANRRTVLNFLIIGFEKLLHFDTSVTSGNSYTTTSVESPSHTSVKDKKIWSLRFPSHLGPLLHVDPTWNAADPLFWICLPAEYELDYFPQAFSRF